MAVVNPYFRFSFPVWCFLFIAGLLSVLTPNPLLTIASLTSLPLFAALLWVRGEPPILFSVVAFQWIEVTTKVFHANVLGITVEKMFEGPEAGKAILLGLGGLLAVALGMRLAMSRLRIFEAARMQGEVTHFSLNRLWSAYLVSFAASALLKFLARKFYPLTQLLLTLSNFKWVIFFVLAYTVLQKKRKKVYLILAVVIEVILGFMGFFSTFRYPFYVLILALLAAGYRMTLKNTFRTSAVLALVIFLSTVWVSISEEYRAFLNLGTRQQIVAVPVGGRFAKLFELLGRLNGDSLKKGFERLANRVAYVDMFAYVLRQVPQSIPYENGALWKRALEHVLMPRIFFPTKPPLPSDTVLTVEYTGMWWAGEEQGTSISMGYMAESYIDFGVPGMFVPVFLLGLLWGLLYRYLTASAKLKIFGYSVAITVLIDTLNFGSTGAKLLGGVITGFIIMALALKFLAPFFNRWLLIRSR